MIDPATLQSLGAKGGGGGNASFGGSAASTQPATAPMPNTTGTGAGVSEPPPTIDQQLYMTLDGVSDPSQLTPMQRGGINTALGTFSGPGSFDNAYYNTPQEFVSQLSGGSGSAAPQPTQPAPTGGPAASTQPALAPIPSAQSLQGKGGANSGGGLSASTQPAFGTTGGGGAGTAGTMPNIQSLQGKGGTGGLF